MITLLPKLLFQLAFGLVLVCGAVIPGPCTFVPDPRWDCSLGDVCPEGFACAQDGFCKSADVACADDETLCAYPGLEEVAICVADDDFATSTAHCGGCFERCRGGASCVAGACVDEPEAGRCLRARGHFDCAGGLVCQADDLDEKLNGEPLGTCVSGSGGDVGLYGRCETNDDCVDGLCVDGVCGRPCDIGCPAFSVCDDDAIPGGLCRLDEADTCAP